MSQKHTIRWVLYHEPVDLFQRTAEAFGQEITRLTDGRINVEVYTVAEFAEKYNLKLETFKRDANDRLYFVYTKL